MNRNGREEKKQVTRRNRRMIFACCVFTLGYLVVAAKAFYLQVLEDAYLSRRASGEYSRRIAFEEKRGTIYDARLRELAVSAEVVSVGVHPGRIEDRQQAAAVLAQHLELDRKSLTAKLMSDEPFVWIRRKVPPSRADLVRRRIDRGLELVDTYSRVYPNKTLAAQVLGFVGIDGNGLEGLEYYYDATLRGDLRQSTIARDALGRIFQRSGPAEPGSQGRNLVLTLDRNIQYIAEEALKKSVLRFNAESGIALAMVPRTGEVKAIAHYPTFNPNAFSEFPSHTWRNRAVTDAFEPGSTVKIFLAAAALESGLFTPRTKVDCEGGKLRVGSHTINDTHPHGVLTLHEVVKYSSNIGAVKIADRIGPETLYETLRRFGFGEKTGIDCPGETPGRIRHYRNWREIDNATIAFGQGISVSAIQLLTAVSAIANHGTMMQPHIVKAVTGPDGKIVKSFEPRVLGQAVSPDTAGRLKVMMQAVTEPDGTGPQAVPEGYTACGKTGTAQVLNEEGTYEDCEYNALFVGFAPARSPELAVLVLVEAPKVSIYGGMVAAPAFSEIVRESFNYMNIAPQAVQNRLAAAGKEGA